MKPPSFRLKMALFSAGLSGLILVVFGMVSWSLIFRAYLDGIDREIRDRGQRELSRSHPPEQWAAIGASFRRAQEADGKPRLSLLLAVRDRRAHNLFKSPDWPPDIAVEAAPLPGPETEFLPSESNAAPPPRPERHPELAPPQPPPPLSLQRPRFFTQPAAGQRWRVGIMGNSEVSIMVAVDLSEVTAGMRRVRNAFLFALPAALLLIAAGSWWLAQRAIRPVLELTRTVERVTATGLNQRVAGQPAGTEFNRLIAVFNQMMDRLERSFNQAVRFSADAAHELKTPLTILQGRLEQAVQRAEPGSDEQRVFSELSDEVQRLKTIVQRLLLLARADAGTLRPNRQPVNLSDMVENLCEDAHILAPQLEVRKEFAPGITLPADVNLIRHLFHNLTDKAIKYNRENGWIRFHLRPFGAAVRFTIANSGRDIPAADQEKIFDRFYRGEPAHGREIDGIGLGLSLAREIARTHHGDLVLDTSGDGVVSFSLTLPLAAVEPPAAAG